MKGTRGNVNAEMVKTITPQELAAAIVGDSPPILVAVRPPEELEGALPALSGARSIPLGELAGLEQRRIVTICKSGGRSSTAAAILGVAGFADVRSLAGGLRGWKAAGLTAER